MVEYLEEPQLTLDFFNYNPFTTILPASNIPRYGNGSGYCCRCEKSYPAEYYRCPIHGIRLRLKPRKKHYAMNSNMSLST